MAQKFWIAILAGTFLASHLPADELVRTGDFTRDGVVSTLDLFEFAETYRNRETDPDAARPADLNGDGQVDELDLFQFLRQWNEDRDRVMDRFTAAGGGKSTRDHRSTTPVFETEGKDHETTP